MTRNTMNRRHIAPNSKTVTDYTFQKALPNISQMTSTTKPRPNTRNFLSSYIDMIQLT